MIFQYQQKAEPILPPTGAADSPPLAWHPTFPDAVPHRHQAWMRAMRVDPPLPASLTEVRVSQAPTELIFAYAAPLTRVSQGAVEILTQYTIGIRKVRVSQVAVEVIYPYGCYVFVPPLPNSCPVQLEPDPNTAPCADDTPNFS